jgi:hypothetical protein
MLTVTRAPNPRKQMVERKVQTLKQAAVVAVVVAAS